MKIFCDFHHSGMAQGIHALFHDRLNHDVSFPCRSFCEQVTGDTEDKPWTFASEEPDTWHGAWSTPRLIDRDTFLNERWDAVIISRTESQSIMRGLLDGHADAACQKIALCGNSGGGFDWDWIRNLLSSDLSTYCNAPPHVHKLHYSQEIGKHFFERDFVPVDKNSLSRVNCFMNFLSNYTEKTWDYSDADLYPDEMLTMRCPHCRESMQLHDGEERCSTLDLWANTRALMPDHQFFSYGNKCEHGHVRNKELPAVYQSAACTWHFKHTEGYGFSVLQSLAAGRPAIVPERFFKYRTAGRYLINELTCFEVPWNAKAIADCIRWLTADLDRANNYAEACYVAADGLFQFAHTTDRVDEWLKHLR